jgi:glutaredoxin
MDDAPAIHLFSLSSCPHCKRVARMLDDRGLPYAITLVDRLDPAAQEEIVAQLKALGAGGAFPVLLMGERVIAGFQEKALREALAAHGGVGGAGRLRRSLLARVKSWLSP